MTPDVVVPVLGIVFGGLVVVVGIVAYTIIMLVNGRRSNLLSDDESRLMQELHNGFTKMERRVETLETLLIERDTKGR
jgi:phage shock protein B